MSDPGRELPDLELIFVHIPKTAGNTLMNVLVHTYGRDRVCFYGEDLPRRKGPVTATELAPATRVLMGHFTFRQLAALYRPQRHRLITFLREPRARYISHFFHLKRLQENANPGLLDRVRVHEPFAVYLLWLQYHNQISRYLAGVELSDLDYVGTVERFEEDILMLAELMGWDREAVKGVLSWAPRVNVNTSIPASRQRVSPLYDPFIRFANRTDIEIYSSALSASRSGDNEVLSSRSERPHTPSRPGSR